MKKLFSLLVIAATLVPTMASAHFGNITEYNYLTGLQNPKTVYVRIKDNSIEPQVKAQYTDILGVLSRSGMDRSLVILRTQYVQAYECAAGIDASKCRAVNRDLQTK